MGFFPPPTSFEFIELRTFPLTTTPSFGSASSWPRSTVPYLVCTRCQHIAVRSVWCLARHFHLLGTLVSSPSAGRTPTCQPSHLKATVHTCKELEDVGRWTTTPLGPNQIRQQIPLPSQPCLLAVDTNLTWGCLSKMVVQELCLLAVSTESCGKGLAWCCAAAASLP